jgi:hypothetical protein
MTRTRIITTKNKQLHTAAKDTETETFKSKHRVYVRRILKEKKLLWQRSSNNSIS